MLRKSLKALLCLAFVGGSMETHAAVSVTAATGGIDLSADKAGNASSPGFTTLGNIVIQENANSDFAPPGGTVVLSAPTGWRFNPGVGTAARQSGNRDMTDPTISVTDTAITVTFTIGGTSRSDRLTISGIQAQALNGANLPSSGAILRTGGTATVSGITAATSFGSLSQIVGSPKQLAIQSEPTASATAGVAFAQQPIIQVRDQFNNLRNAANGAADNATVVTAARLGGEGILQGTLTATANNGSATFSGLFHTLANPITLNFSSGALTSAVSQQIVVAPNVASRLVFTTQPGNATVGGPFGIQPVVRSEDNFGNASIVNLGANLDVTLSLTSGSGVLLGTVTQDIGTAFGNGIVSFSDLQIDAGSADKQLTATANGFLNGVSGIFAVQKQSQEITFGPLSNKTYGDPSFSISASSSSSLPVAFEIFFGSATIDANNITITGAGAVTVRATQAGNDFYDAAVAVDQGFSVAQAVLQVRADNNSRLYGAVNPTFSAQFSGFVNGDTESVISGAPSLTTTASAVSLVADSPFPIVAALGTLSAANYSFTFLDGELAITPASLVVSPDNVTRAYGASNPALTGTFSGIQNGDNITALYETPATSADPVGTSPITLSSLGDPDGKLPNYNVTTNSGTLTITPASLVVTIEDATRAYGSANPTFTGEVTGLQNSDVITATYVTAATPNSSVGSYPITATLQDADGKLTNYSVSTNNGTLTITSAALVVSVNDSARTYGAANPAFSGNISGLLNDDAITAAYSTAATGSSSVGEYPLEASLIDADDRLVNYSVTTNNGTLTITVAPLVVSADNASRAYGSANPEFSGNIAGLLNDDAITASYSTDATGSSPIGGYSIVPSLNDAGNRLSNYSVTTNDGTLTITTAPLIVSADNVSRAYGSANPEFSGNISGLLNNDAITASYSTVALASSQVGDYPIVPSLIDAGDRLSNYSVTSSNGTLTITPAALVVSANDTSRAYGAANPALSGNISGLLNGDVITATYSTVATGSSPVGDYPIVPSLIDEGNRLDNYSVSTNDGTLTITSAALIVSVDDASRAYGTVDPQFSGNISGLLNDDVITASFSTVATGTSPTGSYPIVPSLIDGGNRLGNYSVTTNNGTLTVTAATLVITADNASRVYGAANPELDGNVSGVLNDDAITASFSTVATETSPVGGYAIVASLIDEGNRLSNYSVTTNNGTLTVTAAALVITADNASRVYGAANPAFSGNISGLLNDDAITASYSSMATASSPVGGYPIVPTLVDLDSRLANYSVTTNEGTLTITSAPLVVTADNASRAYGSANPAFSGNISGLLNDDAITATYSTVATVTSPVGSYPIIPKFVDAEGRLVNYSITTNGTLTVTTATLTVTPENATRIYGEANPTFTGSLSGIQNSDDIAAIYSTDATLSSAVGNYDIVFELVDSDGKLVNYSVVTNTGALNVTVAALTITAHNKTKAVGTANPILTGAITGTRNSDDISLLLETTATESSPSGEYPITIVGLADPDGRLSNYAVVTNNATLAVLETPVILSVSPAIIADEGETVVMEVQAVGSALEYQWSFAGDAITDATGSSYTIANVRASQAGSYSVSVSNEFGSDSDSIQLQVKGDSVAPVVKVLTPGSNKIYTNSSLLATGTASDLVRLVSVKYDLNNAGLVEVDNKVSAGKLTNWSSTVTLTPGSNSVFFVATDLAGNSTTSAVVKIIYHQASPLTIVTNGIGAVVNATSPALYSGNNTNLFIGRPYKLVALETGAPQWILTNWTDGNGKVLQTNNLTVNFLMEENMVVNANFIPNPFYRFGGGYNGLFSDTNNGVSYESAGFLTLKVSPKRGFSGKLFLNGDSLSVSGKFQIDGTATVSTKDRFKKYEKPEVTLTFALDFNGATESLSGTVSQGGDWVANLNADRVLWTTNMVDQATTFANAYTMLLPGFTNKTDGPIGSGYGVVTLDHVGKIKLKGESADGQVLKQATVVSKDGAWPVFAPLYKQVRFHSVTLKKVTETKGFVLGWLRYATNALGNLAPEGNLHWISAGTNSVYVNGFTNQNVEVLGSRWLAPVPKSGNRAVEMTNVFLSFSDGNLSEPFQGKFLVSTNTSLVAIKTEIYSNKVKAGLSAKTGLFKGTFVHPETPLPPKKYAGVLLQDYNFGSGFFVGTTEGGSVELDPTQE